MSLKRYVDPGLQRPQSFGRGSQSYGALILPSVPRRTSSGTAIKPLTKSNQSWGMPRRNAALPPINDQMKGITRSQRDTRALVRRSMPNVNIVTGQGVTPNIGISG